MQLVIKHEYLTRFWDSYQNIVKQMANTPVEDQEFYKGVLSIYNKLMDIYEFNYPLEKDSVNWRCVDLDILRELRLNSERLDRNNSEDNKDYHFNRGKISAVNEILDILHFSY